MPFVKKNLSTFVFIYIFVLQVYVDMRNSAPSLSLLAMVHGSANHLFIGLHNRRWPKSAAAMRGAGVGGPVQGPAGVRADLRLRTLTPEFAFNTSTLDELRQSIKGLP
jgi:hypothetical protein